MGWARRRVALEPLSEDAARRLMRRLAAAGDRAAALTAYARLSERLAADLRIAPSAPTRELAEGIRSGVESSVPSAPEAPGVAPPVHYASSGELSIAYQVLGDGPPDLVYVPGFVWHGEAVWEHPSAAGFLRSLSTLARLIVFDKRGMGLSDRPPGPPTLEQGTDDLRAVMDAAGSERAVLFGTSEGGPMSMLFAAGFPERCAGLVLYGTFPSVSERGVRAQALERLFAEMSSGWGGPVALSLYAPSASEDARFRAWWSRLLRLGTSPQAARALLGLYEQIDVRPVLGAIRVPTLVVHRAGDRVAPLTAGRYLAEHIPGARLVELPGDDHIPAVGDAPAVVDAVRSFLAELPAAEPDAPLVTLLMLRGDGAAFAPTVERFRGSVRAPGVATFDGPVRAIRCALALREHGETRIGLHCGLLDSALAGPAAAVARRAAELAGPGEVLVSRVLRDLVAGSSIEFAPREGELFAVVSA